MKIKVAMYKGLDTWHHKLIGWYTGGIYTHAEIVMPDNFTWIGISPFLTSKVSSRIKTDFDLENWDFLSIDITNEELSKLQQFFDDTHENEYDWIGMIASHVLPAKIKIKNQWYCSEWILQALVFSDILDNKKVKFYSETGISPMRLHEIICNVKKE
tara:strand:- start:18477 stop:18947 length:471 start_codon:yes stop_codon:yes gene_type:complete